MRIWVTVMSTWTVVIDDGKNGAHVHTGEIIRSYLIDHDDPAQRRVLGEQCRNAFEAGQCVLTYPVFP